MYLKKKTFPSSAPFVSPQNVNFVGLVGCSPFDFYFLPNFQKFLPQRKNVKNSLNVPLKTYGIY